MVQPRNNLLDTHPQLHEMSADFISLHNTIQKKGSRVVVKGQKETDNKEHSLLALLKFYVT